MMSLGAFWDKIMPLVGPLPERDRALALAMALDHLRGRDNIDDALAETVAEDLRRRFHVPLA
jgi:hypothetical protein